MHAYDSLDLTIDKKFDMWGGATDFYLTINNVGDTRAPLWPNNASNPGLFYPVGGNISNFYDDTGRYFTVGIKGGKFVEPNGATPATVPDAVVSGILAQLPKS